MVSDVARASIWQIFDYFLMVPEEKMTKHEAGVIRESVTTID